MWITINLISSLILNLVFCEEFAVNISQNSLALPRNGFIPTISTTNPIPRKEISTSPVPIMIPTPAKLVADEPGHFEDRIGNSVDANEIFKDSSYSDNITPNTIGIPLQQQTQTQTQSQSALSQATMQIAQTIISQIKNQASANQQQTEAGYTKEEASPWKYPQEQLSTAFSQYSASTEPSTFITYPYDTRRYGYHEQYHKPYEYKAYDYKPYDYKPHDYKPYEYKPYEHKYEDYKHEDYKHKDYKPYDYKHEDYKPYEYKHEDYKPHDYKHEDYKHHDYKQHDYKHHKPDNKLKEVIELFTDFKDQAKKASHNLGKKIAEETKEIVQKLGPIVPVAGSLFVGSLAVKLFSKPNGAAYNYFNKYNNTFPSTSTFPLFQLGRKKRSYDVGRSLVLVFEDIEKNGPMLLQEGKYKKKRSIFEKSIKYGWKSGEKVLNESSKKKTINSSTHYQLVVVFDDEIEKETMKTSQSVNQLKNG